MERNHEEGKPHILKVHPIYGAIYQDGEFVQRGAVLGLSVDAREVVIAPISGWVKVMQDENETRFVGVVICEKS